MKIWDSVYICVTEKSAKVVTKLDKEEYLKDNLCNTKSLAI